MTDETTTTPGQPAAQQVTVDWESRYKGASTVINNQAEKIKALEAQLSSLTSEAEQSKSQLGVKDVEKSIAIGEYQKQLEKALTENSQATNELRELRAVKAKIELARKLNAPELLPILDSIPYVDNPEAMETIMKGFIGWGNDLVSRREKELRAGVTPPVGPSTQISTPQNGVDWQKHINNLPLGSPERQKAMDDWWQWGKASQK